MSLCCKARPSAKYLLHSWVNVAHALHKPERRVASFCCYFEAPGIFYSCFFKEYCEFIALPQHMRKHQKD